MVSLIIIIFFFLLILKILLVPYLFSAASFLEYFTTRLIHKIVARHAPAINSLNFGYSWQFVSLSWRKMRIRAGQKKKKETKTVIWTNPQMLNSYAVHLWMIKKKSLTAWISLSTLLNWSMLKHIIFAFAWNKCLFKIIIWFAFSPVWVLLLCCIEYYFINFARKGGISILTIRLASA